MVFHGVCSLPLQHVIKLSLTTSVVLLIISLEAMDSIHLIVSSIHFLTFLDSYQTSLSFKIPIVTSMFMRIKPREAFPLLPS